MKKVLFMAMVLSLLLCVGSAFALDTCFWTGCNSGGTMKMKLGAGEPVVPDLAILPADFAVNTDFIVPLTQKGKDVYGKSAWGTGVDYTFLSVPAYFTDLKGIYIQTVGGNSASVYGATAMVDFLGAANKYVIGLKLPDGLIVKAGPSIAADIGHGFAPLFDVHFNVGYAF